MLVYLAAPLFTLAERRFNADFAELLRFKSVGVILPQELGGIDPSSIYHNCIKGITRCDAVVVICDGPDVDSGAAFEIGYAVAMGIRVFLLRTDFRYSGDDNRGVANLMITEGCHDFTQVDCRIDSIEMACHRVVGLLEADYG